MRWKAILQRLEQLWEKDSVQEETAQKKAKHLRLGMEGEEAAAVYLQRKRWTVLERNYRSKAGEIDIIARSTDGIVFVEVKSLAQTAIFDPSNHIYRKQMQRIRRSAQMWLDRNAPESPARIDIVGVSNGEVVEHYENVG